MSIDRRSIILSYVAPRRAASQSDSCDYVLPVIPMLDATAPAMILESGIERLGCPIAGDGDWGIVANMPLKPSWVPEWLWAQTNDGNITGATIAPPGVYPTPIYEIGMALAIFWILWLLRTSYRPPSLVPSQVYGRPASRMTLRSGEIAIWLSEA